MTDHPKNLPDDFGPGWYAILSTREVPQDKPLACHRFGLDLVVIRTNAGIRVFPDRCPDRKSVV